MLSENLSVLKEKYPETWKLMNELKDRLAQDQVLVEQAKSGEPTLYINQDGKSLYIHSKYNPIAEAEKFVAQFAEQDLHKYQHLFVYGVGLGYHIEELARRYPHLVYTIYEPSPEIMYGFLSHRSLKNLPLDKVQRIYVENPANSVLLLREIVNHLPEEVLFICLPSYKRAFNVRYEAFVQEFKQTLKEKMSFYKTSFWYEKKWTLNSYLNLKITKETPNILGEKKAFFTNKPALLVSAGPSLDDELANLRYIKENKLAYIFSVGSAINTLVEQGIYPDAACAHDPNEWVINVFAKVLRRRISSIPLIYGTSVGYTLPRLYPGPLLHMFINYDTVSPFFLQPKGSAEPEVINDATTVAITALQLLYKLGCNPIILVGQNLAYKDRQYYASGIKYGKFPLVVEEEKLKDEYLVEDVYGGKVYANESLIQMRRDMELYTRVFSKSTEIINTTKGGAKIAGTSFIPLEQVITERLKDPVVDEDWWRGSSSSYDSARILKQKELLSKEMRRMERLLSNLEETLAKMEQLIAQNNRVQLEKVMVSFSNDLKQMANNCFFQVFLTPMHRVEIGIFGKKLAGMRLDSGSLSKAAQSISEFSSLFRQFGEDIKVIKELEKVIWEDEEIDFSDIMENLKKPDTSILRKADFRSRFRI